MVKRRQESGEERQRRIQREQHRPEQNRGYDEAVRGGAAVADDGTNRSVPIAADEAAESRKDVDDREAEAARRQVLQQDQSASRPSTREP